MSFCVPVLGVQHYAREHLLEGASVRKNEAQRVHAKRRASHQLVLPRFVSSREDVTSTSPSSSTWLPRVFSMCGRKCRWNLMYVEPPCRVKEEKRAIRRKNGMERERLQSSSARTRCLQEISTMNVKDAGTCISSAQFPVRVAGCLCVDKELITHLNTHSSYISCL